MSVSELFENADPWKELKKLKETNDVDFIRKSIELRVRDDTASRYAVANPNTPSDVLQSIYSFYISMDYMNHYNIKEVIINILTHTNCPPEVRNSWLIKGVLEQ